MSKALASPSPSPLRSRSTGSASPPRATSPNRLRTLISQGVINEESPSYISAMEKIYEASWKFDRSKDDAILKVY
ncbi:hypothetical protein EON65_30485 [archaeon]|nr:MAG: hypothetical protein EON65_30485 [archaeon]